MVSTNSTQEEGPANPCVGGGRDGSTRKRAQGSCPQIGAESRPQELGTKAEPRFQELRGSDHL
jgi:hypothetical protein